jgi:catechol 2,3-dioxygenase-like lactoylglutathione lyase family enzyme
MSIVLDHTIVPVKDQDEAVKFYTTILGLKGEGRGGREGQFALVRINDSLTFDFLAAETVPSQHFAFATDAAEFEAAFQRIKEAGIPYGDGPHDEANMKGPGMTHGARGLGKAVYFRDPSGHLLEIKTY